MIVVVGLGNIGIAIAARISECGRDVLGVDLAAERRDEWRAVTGRSAVADLAEVPWPEITHVYVVVRLTNQAEAVLQRLVELPVPRGIPVFLNTTLELDYARGLGRYAERPWRLIELPVSGGDSGARAGTLTVMAAGPLEASDREYLLSTSANEVVGFAEFGDPTLAKLLNNVSAAYTALSYAEMMLLADGMGMEPRRLAEVLRTSSGGSWMGDHFVNLVDDLLGKDVVLLRKELGTLPVVSLEDDDHLLSRLAEARAMLTRPAR
ncbi:MAG: L-threonate 2-dehydrogenase [Pseudonocardiales bacterium]|nr:L-threonate 2-dehydrogenase [Pseudonocardiales bacterium]